ncbi:murein DD-endopeptidase MepM/ murein hydrolase activator NlpD [Mycolicibacterium sp. BK634]|uniref:M23 family metallopeptidase n=1 Tax=Mycobacteriaceae TaxID=1762 RepID=UPI00105EA2D8|nr:MULTISPECIES: M23 family metallopeptidase [Mycobacteriaceae]MBB3749817.1 murein DD-endopeptidase MepM/ murein hydrolase activator NlpD [Mycolicibacterium sp. BK634]TDO18896.1 murein DD-endopeptidase MepM/ murein hydrolase activator NlpD [Mycobacterium sp. BK086]
MTQHRPTPTSVGDASAPHAKTRPFDRQAASIRAQDPERLDVTDIIPFNEFGDLVDIDFRESTAFDSLQVARCPELDDLHDADDQQPLRLAVPAEFAGHADPRAEVPRYSNSENTDILPRTPQHRRQPTSAAKGRVMIAAMAAGAAAAAAYTAVKPATETTTQTVLAADKTPMDGTVTTPRGVQLIAVKPIADATVHGEELANGQAFAQERAEREARLQRPLFVMPTKGVYTSGFGYRWGALHAGVDLAAPIGTPIVAASDGVVVDAGPTAGYGAWVKIRHSDGTVTLYGHVNTWTVQIGQRVFAGDQIATVGNRGNSTGPHLHFEVLLNGTNRIDPAPWLAQRGLSVGPYVG